MLRHTVRNLSPKECPQPQPSFIEPVNESEFMKTQLKLIKEMKKEELKKSAMELKEFGNQIFVENIQTRPSDFGGVTLVFIEKSPDLRVPSLKKNQPVGAIQGTKQTTTRKPFKGIVTRVVNNQYDVYFEKMMQPSKDWTLFRHFNDFQYDILEKAIREIPKNQSKLKEILFGNQLPSQTEIPDDPWFFWFYRPELINQNLDDSQFEAVTFAMKQTELAVLFGPPGTGKTKTLHEIIHQSINRGEKILCTAATNIAIDNLAMRLIEGGTKVVRIGHPARVSSAIVPHCLNVLVQKELQETSEMDRQIQCLDDNLKIHWTKDTFEQLQELKKRKSKSQRRLNTACLKQLKKVPVILSTLTGCSSAFLKLLPKDYFNTCVIDECGQAIESACWTAIHKAPKLILAGDPLQLPPSIISSEKETEDKLKVSLMERLMKGNTASNNLIFCMLNIQYRMNEAIMNFSSINFYSGKLTAHKSVKHQRLSDLPGVTKNDLTTTALQLFDTKGRGYSEISNNSAGGPSYANIGEAALIINYVKRLLEFGIKTEDIAIISPYKYQTEILSLNLLNKGISIKSVDGFQGKEKEVVIISLVRSNGEGRIGFLTESRRLNVAITRAKRHLVIVCDTETICKDKFLEDFINYLKENGQVDIAPRIVHMDVNLTLPKNVNTF